MRSLTRTSERKWTRSCSRVRLGYRTQPIDRDPIDPTASIRLPRNSVSSNDLCAPERENIGCPCEVEVISDLPTVPHSKFRSRHDVFGHGLDAVVSGDEPGRAGARVQ